MIASHDSRHLLSATGAGVFRYDRRWRRSQRVEIPEASSVTEGTAGHFLVWSESAGVIEAEVRTVDQPDLAVASGTFDGSWSFEGDNKRWAFVDEYLVASDHEGREQLVRIVDEAKPVPLDELPDVQTAVAVPGVKLVVLLGAEYVTVLDPETGRVGERLKLAHEDAPPSRARFRPEAEELWLDNGGTLVALDARKWEVIDAAGFEGTDRISHWDFAPNDTVLVGQHGSASMLVLDLKTMLPSGVANAKRPAIDAAVTEGVVVSVDETGAFERTRVKPL